MEKVRESQRRFGESLRNFEKVCWRTGDQLVAAGCKKVEVLASHAGFLSRWPGRRPPAESGAPPPIPSKGLPCDLLLLPSSPRLPTSTDCTCFPVFPQTFLETLNPHDYLLETSDLFHTVSHILILFHTLKMYLNVLEWLKSRRRLEKVREGQRR